MLLSSLRTLAKQYRTSLTQKSIIYTGHQGKTLFHIKELKINVILWPKKQKEISSKRAQKMELWQTNNFGFWRTVKPFLTNNSCISNYFICIENEDNLICNEQEFVELINECYINVVEKSSGKKSLSLGNSSGASQDEMTVKEIIFVYSNHPSIWKIKNICFSENTFDLPYASTSDTNETINYLCRIC